MKIKELKKNRKKQYKIGPYIKINKQLWKINQYHLLLEIKIVYS